MEEALAHWIGGLSWPLLFGVIAVSLGTLGKAADVLVEEAVHLSIRWGVPAAIVGATIVSLGTTAPEAAVSVLAALQGSPGLAMGNAVGSIICDTGLILGIAILLSPLKLDPAIVNRQGWLQLAAGFLLVGASWSGRFPRGAGFFFLLLLAAYLWISVKWARGTEPSEELEGDTQGSTALLLLKLIGAIAVVVLSSQLLIPAVREAATRANIPESIIAATLVAFGTSLPELVTAVTAALKGHGDLAVGNVIGADILNVLFVAGAAAAATPGGLEVPDSFFRILFPAMIGILVVFRIGIFFSGSVMKRPFGFILLAAYLAATVFSYAG